MALRSKPIGVFNIGSRDPRVFSQADEDILWTLSRHAAVIIEKLEFDRKRARLDDIEKQIVDKRDWGAIIQIILKTMTETLGFDYVTISLVIPEQFRIKTKYMIGVAEDEKEEFMRMSDHYLDSKDILADILRTGQIEVPGIQDSRFDPEIYKRFQRDHVIRVFIPMIVPSDGRVIGTVEAGYERG